MWNAAEGCTHVWGLVPETSRHAKIWASNSPVDSRPAERIDPVGRGAFCQHCPAWRGTLGLEPTLDCTGWATGAWCGQCWVCHIAEVFDAVWRILRDDGVCFVNLGDSYAANGASWGTWNGSTPGIGKNAKAASEAQQGRRVPAGLKPKDLCGQPWRVAFALQARGWYLRSAPPWIKASPMPESATDRPGVSHEMWFMLSKKARYFWDAEAVKKPAQPFRHAGKMHPRGWHTDAVPISGGAKSPCEATPQNGRNLRTADFFRQGLTDLIADTEAYLAHLKHIEAHGGLLTDPEGTPAALVFNSTAYSGAHFATFSPAMIRPLIQGGTSERGCCPGCGAPWEREVEKKTHVNGSGREHVAGNDGQGGQGWAGVPRATQKSTTRGWTPTCACPRPPRRPVPCVVFDPFGGAGSVALEADRLGRDAILCEAQPEYVAMAQERLTAEAPLLTTVETPADPWALEQMDLF